MTDKQKLEKMQAELPKENSYFRKNVLIDLLNSIDEQTGNLNQNLYIPQKDREDIFLRDTLRTLGYVTVYDEEYNPYHECYCYKIQLHR